MVPWRQWVAAVCGGDGPQRSAMARARSPVVSLKPIRLRRTRASFGCGRTCGLSDWHFGMVSARLQHLVADEVILELDVRHGTLNSGHAAHTSSHPPVLRVRPSRSRTNGNRRVRRVRAPITNLCSPTA